MTVRELQLVGDVPFHLALCYYSSTLANYKNHRPRFKERSAVSGVLILSAARSHAHGGIEFASAFILAR